MKSNWWWNQSFEGLMTAFGEWLTGSPGIAITNLDWKYVHPPGEHNGYWYMLCVYKPAA